MTIDTQIVDNKKKEEKKELRHKLAPPEVQHDIINRVARGQTERQIAKVYGVAPSSVNEFKARHQESIDQHRQELIQCLPSALEIVQEDLKNGKRIAYRYSYNRKSITDSDLTYKKQIQTLISDLFKMLGFFPHTNTSLHIGKFYQDNRIQAKVTPEFEEFLDYQENNQAVIPDTEAEYKQLKEIKTNDTKNL